MRSIVESKSLNERFDILALNLSKIPRRISFFEENDPIIEETLNYLESNKVRQLKMPKTISLREISRSEIHAIVETVAENFKQLQCAVEEEMIEFSNSLN